MAKMTRRHKHSKYNGRAIKAVVCFVSVLVTLNIILPDVASVSNDEKPIPSNQHTTITATRLDHREKEERSKNESKPEWVFLSSTIEESVTQLESSSILPSEPEWRYKPTDEEFLYACKLAFSEAGGEGAIGQTAVIEVALNSVDYGWADSIIEEFLRPYRYSSVIDGVPQVPAYGGGYRPVTEDDLSEELKEAVRKAFQGERITEQLLKEQAESQGLTDEAYWKGGALYFFNWNAIGPEAKENRNETRMPVRVEIKNHTFARYWK